MHKAPIRGITAYYVPYDLHQQLTQTFVEFKADSLTIEQLISRVCRNLSVNEAYA
jgi:uncharacterized CHY-type Zn-finger protein